MKKQPITETSEIVYATKELVDTLLSMNFQNRNIRKRVVDAYARDINAGRWHLTNQGIGICDTGILADGQHRLEAIKQCGYPPVKLLIVRGLSEQARIAIDQHAKRRAIDSISIGYDMRLDRHTPAIVNVIAKFASNANNKNNSWKSQASITTSEMLKLVLPVDQGGTGLGGLIDFVISCCENCDWFAAPYYAGFIVCLMDRIADKETVSEFIKQVEKGEMLKRTDPAFHLRNFIISSSGSRRGGDMQRERLLKTIKAVTYFANKKEMGRLVL